jgi:hypothetical protein
MSQTISYSPAWDSGARTIEYIEGDGQFTFCAPKADIGVVCGLSDVSGNSARKNEILYGFYIEKGRYCVIESGTKKTAMVDMPYTDTLFTIIRVNGIVRYYVDECVAPA